MFFTLSKVGYFFLTPSNFCVFTLFLGLFLATCTRWHRAGRNIACAGAALLLAFGFLPIGEWLAAPLEQRFAAQPPPATNAVDGIILLGGFEVITVTSSRGYIETNTSGDRLAVIPILARRYPNAKIIFTGGAWGTAPNIRPAGEAVRRFLLDNGVKPERILIEQKSLNTWQNALYVRDLLEKQSRGRDQQTARHLLVTSAWHMPRAIGIFRKVGLNVTAWPVDFFTVDDNIRLTPYYQISIGLRRADVIVKEWIGLLAYWLTGRTSALFPALEHTPARAPDAASSH